MKILEAAGTAAGYPLGLLTGSISFLRAARMFHPRGVHVLAKVRSLETTIAFPPEALLRFSSAMWKKRNWRDVLGVAVRFGDKQDLLFASFEHPWQTPVGPFLTRYKDFFQNAYYAVSPFRFQNETVYFKLTPHSWNEVQGTRNEILEANFQSGVFRLWMRKKKGKWKPAADIHLQQEISLNEEELFFNPFLDGLGIQPAGFIHHLRIGSYMMSQKGRTCRHGIQKVLHHLHHRFIVHRL